MEKEYLNRKFATKHSFESSVLIKEDKPRKDFYTNIFQIKTFIQILGIFVAIFSFIVVGSTQIPHIVSSENTWYDNLLNVSAVLIPLTVVLLILIFSLQFYPKIPRPKD